MFNHLMMFADEAAARAALAAYGSEAGGAWRLIGNAVTGELVHVAAGVDTAMLATAIVEPVPAGSSYRLGG